MPDIAEAFRNADGALQPELLRCLDFMNALPFFRTYKAASWDALRVAAKGRILDVACGVGFDAIELARGRPAAEFVGADRSKRFLDVARARAQGVKNVAFVEGEADRLPFESNAFDGVRIDRSLQHIPSPLDVVGEMVRVARPGGRIVVTEPDWGTFFVYNGEFKTAATIADFWRKSFANPFIGREAGGLLAACGVADIACRAHALTVTRLDEADVIFDLERVEENCVAAGVLTRAGAQEWRAASQNAAQSGSFLACLNIIQYDGTAAK